MHQLVIERLTPRQVGTIHNRARLLGSQGYHVTVHVTENANGYSRVRIGSDAPEDLLVAVFSR